MCTVAIEFRCDNYTGRHVQRASNACFRSSRKSKRLRPPKGHIVPPTLTFDSEAHTKGELKLSNNERRDDLAPNGCKSEHGVGSGVRFAWRRWHNPCALRQSVARRTVGADLQRHSDGIWRIPGGITGCFTQGRTMCRRVHAAGNMLPAPRTAFVPALKKRAKRPSAYQRSRKPLEAAENGCRQLNIALGPESEVSALFLTVAGQLESLCAVRRAGERRMRLWAAVALRVAVLGCRWHQL